MKIGFRDLLIATLLLTTALCLALFLGAPYAIRDMDWDGNGRTSIGEFLYAFDVGRRLIIEDGTPCIEYFHFKDGLPYVLDCDG